MPLEIKPAESSRTLGDDQFLGVNSRLDPQRLPAGYVAEAVNCRFRDGTCAPRKGTLKVAWANKVTSGEVYPWGTVYGTGEFRDPQRGVRYLLIATANAVYAACESTEPFAVAVPGGFALTESVSFAHGPDVVVMLRGQDAPPLKMTSIDTGFSVIAKLDQWPVAPDYPRSQFRLEAHGFLPGATVQFAGEELPVGILPQTTYWIYDTPTADHFRISDNGQTTSVLEFTGNGRNVEVIADGDGTQSVPNAEWGFFLGNRLYLLRDDIIYASDALDYTRVAIYNEMRIHQGGGEALVNAVPFGDAAAICFKDRSVLKVTGLYGDLAARRQSVVTGRYGCVAPLSIVDCGTDLVWLSQEGIASLSLTEYGEIQASQGALAGKPPMLSDDIQPLIRRINWQHARNAVGAFWDNKLFLAVPLDNAEVLRDELVSGNDTYSTSHTPYWQAPVVSGATYKFSLGGNEVYLDNGSELAIGSATKRTGYFVANSDGYSNFTGDAYGATVTGSLRRAFRGVNNAVLVYDFTTRTWQGYDQFEGLDVVEFRKFTYNGRERLFFWTSDGYGLLYEETNEDALPEPYIELVVTSKPAVGNTVSVAGGTTVTVNGNATNGATTWGCSTLSAARENLWTEKTFGFGTYGGTRWTSPNTAPRLVSDAVYGDGVRFVATNGLLPTITTAGTWALVRGATTQPVQTRVRTRAYSNPEGRWHRGLWLNADMATWDPRTSYTLLTDGVGEESVLASDRTKSRTAYYRPFDAPAFVVTNTNDDAQTPHRQDYSIRLGADQAAGVYPGSGVWLDKHQTCTERWHLSSRAARAYQLEIVNARGRAVLQSVRFEAEARTIPTGANA